ncbi:putative Rossmann fold flavoprotein [Peptostreptococcus canis]|nr:putative Rossmann fold flavoprotein [Peptostreptococcus canis]
MDKVYIIMKHIVVIGAGPSGLLAAHYAAKQGGKVTILEKNNILGKKLRITGKGRCNITNASDIEALISNIYRNGNFMYSSLYSYTNENLISDLSKYGLKIKIERGNRVFPKSDKALDVVKTLEKMVDDDNINIVFNKAVKKIEHKSNKITGISLSNGEKIYADAVILATGGLSYPLTGSTGDGYTLAKELGHSITRIKPALIGMETSPIPYNSMVGLNLRNISIVLKSNGKKIYDDFGELEFRRYGIDGPVIKSASCFIEDFKENNYEIVLDLKPALSFEKLDSRIQRDFKKYSNKKFEDSLIDLIPRDMIDYILDLSQIERNKPVHQVTKEERLFLTRTIKNIVFDIKKLRPIDEAIVTSGGISVKEINPSTMESKKIEGLYFAGEIVDVDAFTGGYNLQMAFSMGYLAGVNSAIK